MDATTFSSYSQTPEFTNFLLSMSDEMKRNVIKLLTESMKNKQKAKEMADKKNILEFPRIAKDWKPSKAVYDRVADRKQIEIDIEEELDRMWMQWGE